MVKLGEIALTSTSLETVEGSFAFHACGITPIGNPTFEDWLTCGKAIKNMEKGVHFWIGDWLNYGETTWGEMYKEGIKHTGFAYDTLARAKHVSSRIEIWRRRQNLSFEHHKEAAPYEPDEQDFLLEQAETLKWSAKRLRREKTSLLASIVQSSLVETIGTPEQEENPVYHCSIADLYQDETKPTYVQPASLDAIITDPPYPREHLPVYVHLAEFAIHALKPGGSLIAMVGQSYLPDILDMLRKEPLKYLWLACYYVPGTTTKQWQRNIGISWKPLLWFVKGEYTGPWLKDVIKSKDNVIQVLDETVGDIFIGNGKDKKHHEWGQPVKDMIQIIEHFTQPGHLICDPFVGGGSTAVAAIAQGRRFIGCDIKQECVQRTKQRVKEELVRQEGERA